MIQSLNNTGWIRNFDQIQNGVLPNDAIIQITGEIEGYSYHGPFESIYALQFKNGSWNPYVKFTADDEEFTYTYINTLKFGNITITYSGITETNFFNEFEKAYRIDRKYVVFTRELVEMANTIRGLRHKGNKISYYSGFMQEMNKLLPNATMIGRTSSTINTDMPEPIGPYAFYSYTSLQNVSIDNTTVVGSNAF